MYNIVISFPKSGRTWLRVMLGFLYCRKHNLPLEDALDRIEIYKLDGSYPAFSHDDIDKGIGSNSVLKSIEEHSGKSVVYLHRDIKDVMVSYYFHRKYRSENFKGDISEFLMDSKWGVDKYLMFHNFWMSKRDHVLFLRYEDIYSDCKVSLKKVIEHLEIEGVDDYIDGAVEFGSFQNMRKMEESEFLNRGMLSPKRANEINTYKTRSGQVGSYIEYLSEENIKYIEERELYHGRN